MIPFCKSELDEPFDRIYLRERARRMLLTPLIGLSSGSIAPFVQIDMGSSLVPAWSERDAQKWRLVPPLVYPPNACTARREALREKKRLRRAEKQKKTGGMP